jgi:glucose dehydrogenase
MTRKAHAFRLLLASGVSLALMVLTVAIGRTADDVPGEWRTYNRSLQADRYAPLDQIRSSNVSGLKPVCVYDLNVEASFQTGPIVVGTVLYATTEREVVAIDAGTCALKWRVREDDPPAGVRSGTGTNRGLAYLDGRLFRGMPEGDVIAYDAGSGKKLWSTRIAGRAPGESVPAAPIAWNGLVFAGNAGGDAYGVKGRINALDAATGTVVWTTYTVPADAPQPGNEKMQAQARATWGNEKGAPITGGGTWTSYALDPERGLLYVPVGNPAPDFAGDVRPGDNLYTNSILVLDAKTGIYRDHYALVPADVHDWDVAAAPVLATTRSGKRIVAAAPKDGLLYAYDPRHRDPPRPAAPVYETEHRSVRLLIGRRRPPRDGMIRRPVSIGTRSGRSRVESVGTFCHEKRAGCSAARACTNMPASVVFGRPASFCSPERRMVPRFVEHAHPGSATTHIDRHAGGSITAEALSTWARAAATATTTVATGARWILVPVSGRPSGARGSNVAIRDGGVLALRVAEARGVWSLEPAWTSDDLTMPAAPIVVNGVVFALSTGQPAAAGGTGSAAVLHAYDGVSGKALWNSGRSMTTVASPGSYWSALSQVYVGTSDGTVYAFGFPDEWR